MQSHHSASTTSNNSKGDTETPEPSLNIIPSVTTQEETEIKDVELIKTEIKELIYSAMLQFFVSLSDDKSIEMLNVTTKKILIDVLKELFQFYPEKIDSGEVIDKCSSNIKNIINELELNYFRAETNANIAQLLHKNLKKIINELCFVHPDKKALETFYELHQRVSLTPWKENIIHAITETIDEYLNTCGEEEKNFFPKAANLLKL